MRIAFAESEDLDYLAREDHHVQRGVIEQKISMNILNAAQGPAGRNGAGWGRDSPTRRADVNPGPHVATAGPAAGVAR